MAALSRRLQEAGESPTSLFGFNVAGARRHLTRRAVINKLAEVFAAGGNRGILGHSFRVGGASFRHALGMNKDDVCRLGRWVSRCYTLYIREYSEEDLKRTKSLLSALREDQVVWDL